MKNLTVKLRNGLDKTLLEWLKNFSRMTYDTGYLWMSDDAAKLAEQVERVEEIGEVVLQPGCEHSTEIFQNIDFSDLPVGTKIYAVRPEQ